VSVITACGLFVLLGGLQIKTAAAIIGTLAGLCISTLVAIVFQQLMAISGNSMAEADLLLSVAGRTGMKVSGLLFASVLVASLGAVMDMAISVASAVSELHKTHPAADWKELFRSGMNVGRDMMGTMSVTLIMAFTGASLNMLVLIYSLERTGTQIMNSNAIIIEAMQALSGSIAVVLIVPAVALASALLSKRFGQQK
jgi:uncharacterized membrane protein